MDFYSKIRKKSIQKALNLSYKYFFNGLYLIYGEERIGKRNMLKCDSNVQYESINLYS